MPRYLGDGGGAEIQMTTKSVMHSVAHYLADRNKNKCPAGIPPHAEQMFSSKNNIPLIGNICQWFVTKNSGTPTDQSRLYRSRLRLLYIINPP